MEMKIIRKVCKYLLVACGMIALLFLGLMISFSLPNGNVREHVENASKILNAEGEHPNTFTYNSMLDNFTDAIILQAAYCQGCDEKSPIERAVDNTYTAQSGRPIKGLEALVTDDEDVNMIHYPRYWFGTSGVVRVLMEFMGLKGIRRLMLAAVIGLIVTVIILFVKRAGWKYGAAFAAAIFLASPWVIGVSLQYICASIYHFTNWHDCNLFIREE